MVKTYGFTTQPLFQRYFTSPQKMFRAQLGPGLFGFAGLTEKGPDSGWWFSWNMTGLYLDYEFPLGME